MSGLRFDRIGRCPVGAACISCGVDSAGARVITACPPGLDTCGAPAGQPCESWCASQAAEPEPGPLVVAVVDSPYGELCLTVCWGCSAAMWLPRLTADAAMRLALDHATHIALAVDGHSTEETR
jgi:hypothetical protein